MCHNGGNIYECVSMDGYPQTIKVFAFPNVIKQFARHALNLEIHGGRSLSCHRILQHYALKT